MHPHFLDILACPSTGEPLTLNALECSPNGEIISGTLTSPSGKHYPIIRGIPRFVNAQDYAASFGLEWSIWPRLQFEAENLGKPMEGHTTHMWETIVGTNESQIRGKLIAEFGCGSGRFLDVVRRKGGIAVGIDLSSAVEQAHQNLGDDPNVLIVQGDVTQLPFRDKCFDGCYSIGVLHHIPDPISGMKSINQRLKDGGWMAICVYPKGEFYDYASVARFRKLINWIKPMLGYFPALIYAFFSAYIISPLFWLLRHIQIIRRVILGIERNWLVILPLRDLRWAALDIFDAITPSIARTYTSEEVIDWFTQTGLSNISPSTWCRTSFVGIKRT